MRINNYKFTSIGLAASVSPPAVKIDKEYATLGFNINPARLTELNTSHE